MKVKTSVSLSPETIRTLDRLAGKRTSRSRIIEQAVLELAARRDRARRDAREIDVLNASADELNREMTDILAFQADL